MLRILYPGQPLPDWIPYRVIFSREADGQEIRIGCWSVAWRFRGHVSLRNLFGGSVLVVESGGAEVKHDPKNNVWIYSFPLIPLRYGASVEVRRRGRTVQWVGHTDDLQEVP